MNNQWFSKVAVWLVIAMVLFTVFKQFDTRVGVAAGYIRYSEFLDEVRNSRIKSATIQEGPGGTEIVAITNDERRILEMKYSWRRSNRNISDILHCDEKRIPNKHYKIITYLTECLKNMPSCKKSAKSPQKIQSFVV